MPMRNVTLEMSLKPFFRTDGLALDAVCEEAFSQWRPLLADADGVSVLLWSSDGSEILDYAGDLDRSFEWACWIGAANPREDITHDPQRLCLHSRPRLYRENPPTLTYRTLARIVAALKQVGARMLGKSVRVGATFDPGGEFARSSFKYERHNEICLANTMGKGSFVCCYATLHADTTAYAGFPQGIPEGLPLGTFLGRQARHFLADLGFDYLWLSNGFGFGLETWKPTGPLFDGQRFDPTRAGEIRDRILGFWRAFRAECDCPVEVRGTNLGTGADLATDAVPLRDIYRGGFNIATPPNSPWAAIDGNFGIELVGYMSRIVETANPDGSFPYRFYIHDPWWLNSPWLDRYGREPHDIYLPLAVSRVDAAGQVRTPDCIELLTIDDSLGAMPPQCPSEIIPHIQQARRTAPDAPGPLVWVYPFDECHDRAFGAQPRLEEPYFNDWFISSAISNGLPLNTVVSTGNFLAARAAAPRTFAQSTLLAPVPEAGTAVSEALLDFARHGGRVLLYGPFDRADPALRDALCLQLADGLEGEMALRLTGPCDELTRTPYPDKIVHRPTHCAGPIHTVWADPPRPPHITPLAEVSQGERRRVAAMLAQDPAWQGGAIAYVRGAHTGGLRADETFPGDVLLRLALAALGEQVLLSKRSSDQRSPITTIARHDGAFWFSGYVPDTTVELRLRLRAGAPLLVNTETVLTDGRAGYRFGRAWRRECRVFVRQDDGPVACVENITPQVGFTRRLMVHGLRNAGVSFFPPHHAEPTFQLDGKWPYVTGPFVQAQPQDDGSLRLEGITGSLLISW